MLHIASNFLGKDTPDFLQYVEDVYKKEEELTGTIDGDKINKQVRDSRIKWSNEFMLKRTMADYINNKNADIFNFDLYYNHLELQYTTYDSKVKGHYTWHSDDPLVSIQKKARKLSATIQLTTMGDDYEGGEFEIRDPRLGKNFDLPNYAFEKGTIIIFPSALEHRVKPVIKGLRKSLVVFQFGPSWR